MNINLIDLRHKNVHFMYNVRLWVTYSPTEMWIIALKGLRHKVHKLFLGREAKIEHRIEVNVLTFLRAPRIPVYSVDIKVDYKSKRNWKKYLKIHRFILFSLSVRWYSGEFQLVVFAINSFFMFSSFSA